MNDRILLSTLLEIVKNFVEEQNFNKTTTRSYNAAIKYMKRFYEQQELQWYSPDVSWECVLERRQQYESQGIKYATFMYTRKVAAMLSEYYSCGKIIRCNSQKWNTIQKTNLFDGVAENYRKYLIDTGYSTSTISSAMSDIYQFLVFIEKAGYTELSKIQRHSISEFLYSISKKRASGVYDCLSRLRTFFRYLVYIGMIDETLLATLQIKPVIHRKIHAGFTPEESDAIIDAIDRDTPIGKRDYAILLLGRYTGLRAIDVIRLKLYDIDWLNREINIVQHKTQRPLTLPLENVVGNAIADYILNARPKSDSDIVFLRGCPPYVPLSQGTGSSIVTKYVKRSGIKLNPGVSKGFHSFRRAIGANMLSADIPLTTVSEVLGHSSYVSTKPYISLSANTLRICAMPLTGLECLRKEFL